MENYSIYIIAALKTLIFNGEGSLSNDDLKMFKGESSKAEKDTMRIGEIYENTLKGFFHCAAKGFTFIPEEIIIEKYGRSVEQNYPEASNEFLKFAKTYWTLKILVDNLIKSGKTDCLESYFLGKLEQVIGPLFFPFPGPMKISPKMREKDQRELLKASGANIDIEKFIKGNPILIRDKQKKGSYLFCSETRWHPIMLLKPKWVKLLPSNLRPDKKRISELEKLRNTFGISHEDLSMRVIGSPATTRKVQRQCIRNFRNQNPEAPEKELLKMVLISRIIVPPSIEMTEQEIDQAMENINSFDDLCDYIIALDEKEPSFPDTFGIGKRIDEILAGEEIEEKSS